MSDGLLIEWGRAPRGRLWHLLSPGDLPFCSQHLTDGIKETTQDVPPVGSQVCGGCADVVDDLTRAVIRARNQRRPRAPAPAREEPEDTHEEDLTTEPA